MPPAKSISLNQFTTAVQSAVKAAVKRHPKFQVPVPEEVTFSYLIRGFPVPPTFLNNATFAEAQAFVNDVATGLGTETGVADKALIGQGVIYSGGGHTICGIPPAEFFAMKQ